MLSGYLSAYSPNTDISVFTDNIKVDDTVYSKNVLVTDTLTAENILVHFIDVVISETSGFAVKGLDFNQTVPVQCPISDVLLLSGVGLSGTSWASFQGNIQTSNNLIVSGNANIAGSLSINGCLSTDCIKPYTQNATISVYTDLDLMGNSISGIGNDSLSFESGAKISSDISKNIKISDNLVVSGIITTLAGNSNQWQSNWTTVNTNSAGWESVETSVNSNSANWGNVWSQVNNLSSGWSLSGGDLGDIPLLSGNWNSTYTTVNANSAVWNSYSQSALTALEAALSGLQGGSVGSLGTSILTAAYDTWELVTLPTFIWAYATNVYTSDVNSDLKLMVAEDGAGSNSILLNYGRAYTAGASQIHAFNVQGLVPPNKYWKVTANDTPSAINIYKTILSGGGVSELSAGYWNSAYTTVQTQSAAWGTGGTIFSGSTIVTTVTSTGEFLTITFNGSARAIPLYLY